MRAARKLRFDEFGNFFCMTCNNNSDKRKNNIKHSFYKKIKRIGNGGKLRFDEFGNFFCILSGAMTIVGPRPERPEIAKQYSIYLIISNLFERELISDSLSRSFFKR